MTALLAVDAARSSGWCILIDGKHHSSGVTDAFGEGPRQVCKAALALDPRFDEPVADQRKPQSRIKKTSPPPVPSTDTPACSKAQGARKLGAQGRLVMRNVGLDLGVRHIAYCEVADGKVIDRVSARSLSELKSRLGPDCPAAHVAFEACREGWHVHDTLERWGNEPWMLDTTRVRQIGV